MEGTVAVSRLVATLWFVLLLLPLTLFGQSGYPDFEIVESTPLEAGLDFPTIRNTRDVWVEMIGRARKTLDVEEFYLSAQKGESLDDVIAALLGAAARGVKVRIIADARMHKTYPEPLGMFGKTPNIEVRIVDFAKLSGGVQHAKFFIVDGTEIFLGSQNFDWRSLVHIHELGLRINHPEAAGMYEDIFDLDWQLAEKNDPSFIPAALHRRSYPAPYRITEPTGDTVVFRPTMSPKGLIIDSSSWDEKNIVSLIDAASRDVFCQFLTYSPGGREYYPVLNDALRRAGSRGVRVHMIVSDWSIGHPTIDSLENLAAGPGIEIKFSAIPEWSGGYIPYARVEHCKFLVIDSSACWLGTANWEKSYFYATRNVGAVVWNRKIASTLREIFERSWKGPYVTMIRRGMEAAPRRHGEK